MKTVVSLTVRVRAVISFAICACCWLSASLHAQTQTNSWTNSTSGNWEDAYWSLGQLPNKDQSISFTNDGSKTLTVGSNTVENFPETLTVNYITVSSTPGSVNTLVLDHTGLQAGLDTGPFTVGTNSVVQVYSSSLDMHGDSSLAGIFDEAEAWVFADFSTLYVGESGPAIFNLTNSFLGAQVEYLGGFPTVFNQQAGTNSVNTGLVLKNQSQYNLFDGYLDDGSGGPILIVFEGDEGEFNQYGGNFSTTLRYWQGRGSYHLIGGALSCGDLMIPGNSSPYSCSGYFSQSGGTNVVGTITIRTASDYLLSGGWLLAQNIQDVGPPDAGAAFFWQSGGTNEISGNLLIDNSSFYRITGGQLFAQSVTINNYSDFYDSGGVLEIQFLSLGGGRSGGTWNEESNGHQLGQLMLAGYNSGSFFILPNHCCVLEFADSSDVSWSSNTALFAQNWSGSLYGGGSQQIIFGSNSAALTSQQLSQIQFQNPAGLAPGNYPARILATGEIVPDTGAPLPPRVNLGSSNGVMHLSVGGDIGQTYAIDVSTDLVHWLTWTSQWNTNGTISIEDDSCVGFPQRFYRAHVLP